MAKQASRMPSKYTMALALNGATASVATVASSKNASVPSDPTIRWAMMLNGSLYVISGRIFSPVTFLMEYL